MLKLLKEIRNELVCVSVHFQIYRTKLCAVRDYAFIFLRHCHRTGARLLTAFYSVQCCICTESFFIVGSLRTRENYVMISNQVCWSRGPNFEVSHKSRL